MSAGETTLSFQVFLDAWVQAEEELKHGGRKLWPLYIGTHMHAPVASSPYAFGWRKCMSRSIECFPRAVWQAWHRDFRRNERDQ